MRARDRYLSSHRRADQRGEILRSDINTLCLWESHFIQLFYNFLTNLFSYKGLSLARQARRGRDESRDETKDARRAWDVQAVARDVYTRASNNEARRYLSRPFFASSPSVRPSIRSVRCYRRPYITNVGCGLKFELPSRRYNYPSTSARSPHCAFGDAVGVSSRTRLTSSSITQINNKYYASRSIF